MSYPNESIAGEVGVLQGGQFVGMDNTGGSAGTKSLKTKVVGPTRDLPTYLRES